MGTTTARILVLVVAACGVPEPKPKVSTHTEPVPAECAGPVERFTYESREADGVRTIEGQAADGGYALEYRYKGRPEGSQRKVVLAWRGPATEAQLELISAGVDHPSPDPGDGASGFVTLVRTDDCHESGRPAAGSLDRLESDLHEQARSALPVDAEGRRAIGHVGGEPVYRED